jgi:hypothetical protein
MPGADSTGSGVAASIRSRLSDIAWARRLDAELVAQWVAHLRKATRDSTDPFHLWATAAAPDGRLSELQPLVGARRARANQAEALPNGAKIVIDYGRCASWDWMPDGAAFGTRPTGAGDLRLGGTTDKPMLQFTEKAAAQTDSAWNGLRPAAGVENDPGAIGAMVRAGRTIRTPRFTLSAGKLFYLVRGQGMAYAAVDQHVLIKGPLHAELVREIDTAGKWRWVGHDLAPYRGHRTHVELTAAPGADFAVAMVVQAGKEPGLPGDPNAMMLRSLSAKEVTSPAGLASGYRRIMLGVVDSLAADRLIGKPRAADHARLANWLVCHMDLLTSDPTSARKTLAAKTRRFFAQRSRLLDRIRNESRQAPAIMDGNGVDEYVFIRGSPKTPGETVPRRFLEALAGPGGLAVSQGSGRLQLARPMADPQVNPFLARVMVNRLWHHLFGRGLVASVDNFGVLGEPPTHPELLDYLAEQFVKDGWSIKRMIRRMVLSRAYQMASHAGGSGDEADPQDLILHRMRVRRLEGEAIRDAMLLVSGRFDARMYGPSVPVYLTPFLEGRGRPVSGPLDGDGRRSLYTAVRRNFLPPMMLAFDTPIPFSTVGRRTMSNVPAQALILMNDPFVHQQAEVWARRVLAQPGTRRERIISMYQTALSRPPGESELSQCLGFLHQQAKLNAGGMDDPASWADLAHVIFNLKEFIFLH